MARTKTRRLTFSTIFNVRDLEGLPTAAGPMLPRRLLRSGDTMFLSQADADALLAYGVRRVLDLRMSQERPEMSDPFARMPAVSWKNIPLQDDETLSRREAEAGKVVDYLIRQYTRMLEDRKSLRRILAFVAGARPDECVLIHCALGHDRTGIVCMLIEGICGVEDTDLIRDFAYSFGTREEVDKLVAHIDEGFPWPRFDGCEARVAAFRAILDEVENRHGSIENMVRSWGVTASAIDAIIAHATGQEQQKGCAQ